RGGAEAVIPPIRTADRGSRGATPIHVASLLSWFMMLGMEKSRRARNIRRILPNDSPNYHNTKNQT
ncbi:MAG: hypothetical protein SPF16_03295, partial [Prevotella sp.]|nr:hypothetical protein [Prevotella sp.]